MHAPHFAVAAKCVNVHISQKSAAKYTDCNLVPVTDGEQVHAEKGESGCHCIEIQSRVHIGCKGWYLYMQRPLAVKFFRELGLIIYRA